MHRKMQMVLDGIEENNKRQICHKKKEENPGDVHLIEEMGKGVCGPPQVILIHCINQTFITLR